MRPEIRTILRTIGIALISYGMGLAGQNPLLSGVAFILGLLILGFKDWLEESQSGEGK